MFRVLPGPQSDRYLDISPFTLFSRVEIDGRPYYRITNRFAYRERNVSFPIERAADGINIVGQTGRE